MQQDESFRLSDDLNEFAKRLTSFEARSAMIDRDQLVFEAGQVAARTAMHAEFSSLRRTLHAWKSTAVVLLAFSLGLGVSYSLRQEQPPQNVFVERQPPVVFPNTDRASDTGLPSVQAVAPIAAHATGEAQERLSAKSTVVATAASAEIAGLQTRLSSIERMIEGLSNSSVIQVNPDSTAEFAHRSEPIPVLNPRMLLHSEGSRALINRFIEEPNL